MSKYIIALKSLLSKTNLSAAIFFVIVSPRFWFWYKQMLNTSTMHVIGSLASCYLSLLCSRPPFLWLCQGTVIKGICLCRYKTAVLSYWIFNDFNFNLPHRTSSCLFSCTIQYCKVEMAKILWYPVNTKKRKVTEPIILLYKCLVRFDWWVAACVQS